MCLATPVQIKSKIKNQKSKMIIDGNREVDISLVPDVGIGDWLLCHKDFAVNKISAQEARDILSLVDKCRHDHC